MLEIIRNRGLSSLSSTDESLLFHLDGHDITETLWVDKVRGISFNTSGGTIDLEKHFFCPKANVTANGEGAFVTGVKTFHFVLELDCTRELFDNTYYVFNRSILHNNSAGQSAALHLGQRLYVPQGNLSGPRSFFTDKAKVINPLIITATSSPRCTYANKLIMPNGNSGWFPVTVPSGNMVLSPKNRYYDIKLFNRVLSEEEMLALQQEDIEKYNLSL